MPGWVPGRAGTKGSKKSTSSSPKPIAGCANTSMSSSSKNSNNSSSSSGSSSKRELKGARPKSASPSEGRSEGQGFSRSPVRAKTSKAQCPHGLGAGGLWTGIQMTMIALSITMVIMSIPRGQPQDVGASIYLADKVLEGLGFEKHPGKNIEPATTSGALSAQVKSSQAAGSPVRKIIGETRTAYMGQPTFSAYDCFADNHPTVLKMPSACRTGSGSKAYTGKEKMKKVEVNLFQSATTRKFTGRFCRVEKSSSSFLCGMQDWTQVLSPPIVGESETLSGPACQDMYSTGTFSDLAYHRKFPIKKEGVTVYAYTARGTLQTSGTSVYCYGNTGRILNGDVIDNSLVFQSYRITMGVIKGRREVHGHRDAVITEGPLSGVPIRSKQVTGGHVLLGTVTVLLDPSFYDDTCPLAAIRKKLTMFVIPGANVGASIGAPSTHPGDKVYDVNGKTGTPPNILHNYTLLVTGAQDLVLNLGEERKMPETCGSHRYIETSHSHVLATLNQAEDRNVELLPLDLELLEASTEYSARLDLLSYLTQLSLASLNDRYLGDTCIGNSDQLAGLLERATTETKDGVHRLVPAGEVIYRLYCPKKKYGAEWMQSAQNCSELLPVRLLSGSGELMGQQLFMLPQTRYVTRHQSQQACPDLPSAFVGDDGQFYIWAEGRLKLADPQPGREADFNHLLPTGLPDFTGQVAGGREIYTRQEEDKMISRLDFGIFIHGQQDNTLAHQEREGPAGGMGAGSGSSRTWVTLPGVTMDGQLLEHPAMEPVKWLWARVGLPIWHLLLTLGALGGLASGLSWAWGLVLQVRSLMNLGSTVRGETLSARGWDLFTLSASSSARARRIRELEGEQQEDRILRAQARVLSATRALSATSLHHQEMGSM